MAAEPLISVIVPIYNVEVYLPECLDSICGQSHRTLQIILVDDGSTDNSGEICDQYAARDPRIRVIHKPNSGAASAKNVGLAAVRGDYVAFVDSDDYVEPHWLERAVEVMQSMDADVVEFAFDKIYRSGSEPESQCPEPENAFTAREYLGQYLSCWTCSLFCNKLIRAELVQGIRFRTERRCIDDEFFTYKVVSGAKRIVRIPDVLYHYRQRRSSAVYNEKNRKQIADDALEILIERYEWVSARFPDLRRTYLDHDLQILFYFAGFHHTAETVTKFRRISKYYLQQAARFYPRRIPLAIKLQCIPNQELLAPEKKPDEQNMDRYFQ